LVDLFESYDDAQTCKRQTVTKSYRTLNTLFKVLHSDNVQLFELNF